MPLSFSTRSITISVVFVVNIDGEELLSYTRWEYKNKNFQFCVLFVRYSSSFNVHTNENFVLNRKKEQQKRYQWTTALTCAHYLVKAMPTQIDLLEFVRFPNAQAHLQYTPDVESKSFGFFKSAKLRMAMPWRIDVIDFSLFGHPLVHILSAFLMISALVEKETKFLYTVPIHPLSKHINFVHLLCYHSLGKFLFFFLPKTRSISIPLELPLIFLGPKFHCVVSFEM